MIVSQPTRTSASFSELGVPSQLVDALEALGISSAFPIQVATLPDAISGRDVCGKAPTGSGKTLAFGLALLSRMANEGTPQPGGRRHPRALVLVPTRELAAQIEEVIAPLARAIGVKVASIYGGVGYAKQFSTLQKGVDIVVACPGRLEDLLQQGVISLSHVSYVVVDEADRMADMGFLPAVRKLIDKTNSARQTLLFSATLDGPVDRLIRDYQHDPVRHDVKLEKSEQAQVIHHFWRVDQVDRIALTSEIISLVGPAVVFCRTKRGADRLAERLSRAGIKSAAIHGNRSQPQRERALGEFRAGRLDALVATDIAARGIHVDAVPLVVHFDPPADVTDYVHRSGRTGRAGVDGTVVALVGPEHLSVVAQIQRTLSLPTGITFPNTLLLGGEMQTPAPRQADPRRVARAPRPPRTPRVDAPGRPVVTYERPPAVEVGPRSAGAHTARRNLTRAR
ncbi:MAG: DEAD/DEAH box helicase [Acidimicrobiales bacterium]